VCVLEPRMVDCDHPIVDVAGGEHHSIIITDEAKALVFGRVTTKVLGLPQESHNEDNTIYDDKGKPAIASVPTELPNLPRIKTAAIGTETSYVITEEGHAYAWGSNCNFQCGVGAMDEVLLPVRLDNSVVIDRKIIWGGAGGQYGMLAAAQEAPAVVEAPVVEEAAQLPLE
jgi:regulator of chromosome condensation